MVRLGAKRLGIVVGAILTVIIGCGADPTADVGEPSDNGLDSEPLELAARPTQLLTPPAQSRATDNVCASDIIDAQPVPVNLYLMIDRSGSMQEGNKWGQSMAALRAFVEAPSTSGLRVALRFFGDSEPVVGCSQQDCSIDACAQPLVEVGELAAARGAADEQERALVERLEQSLPRNGFGTPIYPALGGALKWATTYKAAHAKEKVAVVFVTDGEPNGCDTNMDHISGLASDAYTSAAVRTYAIGLEGSNEQQMDQIAEAGQTKQGIFIGSSAQAERELLQALTAIRAQSMSCDFLLPEPSAGETADITTVNVAMNTRTQETQLYRVANLEACSDDGQGWYFDDPAQPERIHLCPSACSASNQAPDTHISVVMGCVETRRAPALR